MLDHMVKNSYLEAIPPTSLKADLHDKRALVTGGTRSIGIAITQRLTAAGATVITAARTPGQQESPGSRFLKADIRTIEGVQTLAEEATAELGGIDILINNAGAARPYPSGVLSIKDDEWRDALDINYLASVRLDAAVVPGMIEAGSGVIVHISSSAALTPIPALLHYGAAKAALIAYSKGLSAELAAGADHRPRHDHTPRHPSA
jgi:NAD(P)-dependent dehydrogenase (short-subunit alcohol dehydrogenase family)